MRPKKFRSKTALTLDMLTCKRPLIVVVAPYKSCLVLSEISKL